MPPWLVPALTAILALVLSLALFDQWNERRGGFQLIWALGMLFFGVASACEAIGAGSGWNETLYRVWYLTGAVWTAGCAALPSESAMAAQIPSRASAFTAMRTSTYQGPRPTAP